MSALGMFNIHSKVVPCLATDMERFAAFEVNRSTQTFVTTLDRDACLEVIFVMLVGNSGFQTVHAAPTLDLRSNMR